MATHLPSLQLVTELPVSTKGGAKGHVLVRGAWAGLLEHSERPFSPNHSLELQGKSGQEGPRSQVGRKWVVARLNKLFEIATAERHYETMLTARNLLAVVQESQAYIINILPRKLPKKVVSGEHYVLKDLPFYKEAPKKKRSAASLPGKAPAKKRKPVLHNKGKEVKLPTLPKEFVRSPITYEKEVTIKEPENPLPPSISSSPGHLAGLNHSGPSMSAAGRLALLAEEVTSINQPRSPHPDAGVAEASCATVLPPMATLMEEMGEESQSLPSCGSSPLALVPVKGPASKRSRSTRNLKSGLIGRLQDRFQETIEVSCSYRPV
ncbi:hypothetical protein CK203_072662 [Vitis vinifera]|uniref:Uncharacterized protein n=1 Tax=Vitis vinifera TaxID=29760 RepID=A0A438EZ22_VITVI|nr:hypothetical protein CK203_072662 [Vitis vinifera]